MSDNTDFSLLGHQLSLVRHPAKHQHKSLQAWDSADELLIEYLQSDNNSLGKTIILNDDFGALGCWYIDADVHWFSDSWIAHRSLADNLALNGIDVQLCARRLVSAPISAHDSLVPLPDMPDTVIIKIPRTLALLEHQLIALAQVIKPETTIVAGAKVKLVTRSVLALFEKYLGPTKTSLAKKKSRLIFCQPTVSLLQAKQQSPYPTVWPMHNTAGQTFQIHNHANVFSRQSLDIGARFLLEHMQVTTGDNIIDLGCGNGVLGLNALTMADDVKVAFVDESFMAVASARENVQRNLPELTPHCRFIASNCLDALRSENVNATKVFCNPPFHQQNAITDHIAWQMFKDARDNLVQGGHLIVVGNRHLEYHVKLKKIFGGVSLLASHQKFVILSAAKR